MERIVKVTCEFAQAILSASLVERGTQDGITTIWKDERKDGACGKSGIHQIWCCTLYVVRDMKLLTKSVVCLFAVWLLTYTPLASAYIGPGLGAGAIASVLGIASGLLMLLVGVVWYPVKRLVRRLRSKK